MIEPEISTVWVWCDLDFKMIKKIKVNLNVIGNKGSLYAQEGPILIDAFSQFHETWEILKHRLYNKLDFDESILYP